MSTLSRTARLSAPSREKPLLRGVSHQIAAFVRATQEQAEGSVGACDEQENGRVIQAAPEEPPAGRPGGPVVERADGEGREERGAVDVAASRPWPGEAAAANASQAASAIYTAGAVVYALRRPDPFPRVFGYTGCSTRW